MPTYRIYTFDKGGHVREPPKVIECKDDEAAVKEAKQLLDGKLIEVWEKARRIIRLDPPRRGPTATSPPLARSRP